MQCHVLSSEEGEVNWLSDFSRVLPIKEWVGLAIVLEEEAENARATAAQVDYALDIVVVYLHLEVVEDVVDQVLRRVVELNDLGLPDDLLLTVSLHLRRIEVAKSAVQLVNGVYWSRKGGRVGDVVWQEGKILGRGVPVCAREVQVYGGLNLRCIVARAQLPVSPILCIVKRCCLLHQHA